MPYHTMAESRDKLVDPHTMVPIRVQVLRKIVKLTLSHEYCYRRSNDHEYNHCTKSDTSDLVSNKHQAMPLRISRTTAYTQGEPSART